MLGVLLGRPGIDRAVERLYKDIRRGVVGQRVAELELDLITRQNFIDEQSFSVSVEIIGSGLSLALVLQPDQGDIVILNEAASLLGWGTAGVGDGDGPSVGSGIWQRGNEVREVTGLVDLRRIDGRLPMFGAYDEQGGVVDALSLESLDHAAESIVGFLQGEGENGGWSSRPIRVSAGLPGKCRVCAATAVGVVLGEFLPDTDGLEIHAENCRHARSWCAIVFQPLDFVEDSLNL